MIVLTIAVAAVVVSGSFLFFKKNDQVKNSAMSQPIASTKTYMSQIYDINFNYPVNWTVYEDAAQLDIQPPSPAQRSNYFTLEILDGNKTLKDYIATRNLKKAAFTIDGKEVYMDIDNNTDTAGTMLYFLFTHRGKVYQLYLFETLYNMPEIKAMIASLRLN